MRYRTRHYLYLFGLTATLAAGCTLADEAGTPPTETRTLLGRGTVVGFDFDRLTDIEHPPGTPVGTQWQMRATATAAPSDVVMGKIDLPPGACVPWHYHAGAVFVIVETGTGTNYLPIEGGCSIEIVPAGTALVGDGLAVHSMCNNGPDDLVTVFVTYIVPQGLATNIPLPNPGTCPGGAL